MARPSDISTKVVSFRVPMKDYIKLLTLATEKGLSISDYMLMRVYGPDGEITEGKSLAGTKSQPAAGQDPVQSPKAVADPVPESKPEVETTLSGVSKRPRKKRSSPKTIKANKTKAAAEKPVKKPRKASNKPDNKAKIAKLEAEIAKKLSNIIAEQDQALQEGDVSRLKKLKALAKKEQGKIDQIIQQLSELGWKKEPKTFLNGLTDEREKKVFATLME